MSSDGRFLQLSHDNGVSAMAQGCAEAKVAQQHPCPEVPAIEACA
jgi:hypothetical protein